MTSKELAANMEAQLEEQGVASYRVKDGEVFVFTEELLSRLLTEAVKHPSGTVVLFVKQREIVKAKEIV